jgi:hypothetical protein
MVHNNEFSYLEQFEKQKKTIENYRQRQDSDEEDDDALSRDNSLFQFASTPKIPTPKIYTPTRLTPVIPGEGLLGYNPALPLPPRKNSNIVVEHAELSQQAMEPQERKKKQKLKKMQEPEQMEPLNLLTGHLQPLRHNNFQSVLSPLAMKNNEVLPVTPLEDTSLTRPKIGFADVVYNAMKERKYSLVQHLAEIEKTVQKQKAAIHPSEDSDSDEEEVDRDVLFSSFTRSPAKSPKQ